MQVALSGIGPKGGICDRIFAGAACCLSRENAREFRWLAEVGLSPLEDVGALEQVGFVMKGGVVVRGPAAAAEERR